jgi:pimeloyl-ACP methyl ester carboxylesterase
MLTRYRIGRVTQTSAERRAGSALHRLGDGLLAILLMLSVGLPAMAPAPAHMAELPVSTRLILHRSAPKPIFAACPKGVPPHAMCGTVTVLLDSADPGAGTLPIAFELYRHTRTAQPALGTIVPSLGGPGISDTAAASLFLGLFGPLLDRWDLLIIDHRGMGRSAAINCPAIQHLKGDFLSGLRACGAQLGAAAGRYGSGDVADDIDAVRAALGIDKIDYVGASYGGFDIAAYALRHADHLRSAVLESPVIGSDDTFSSSFAPSAAKVQARVCRRSPSCAAANPDPPGTLAWLAKYLRAHPFDGTGYDADGAAHTLHVDETTLLHILYVNYFSDPLINQGEVTAAAEALRKGDRLPLLRLAAESPVPTDLGDAAGFQSMGANIAVYCSDGRFVWDKTAPEATRRAQYNTALAALPPGLTAPFSLASWVAHVKGPVVPGPGADTCIPWPAPTRPNPPFAPNSVFAQTPALIMAGDFDFVPVGDVKAILKRFPKGHFVEVANAGHFTGVWSPCAQAIDLHFIATLQVGDTRCARDIRAPFHAFGAPATNGVPLMGVDRFPRLAAQALPARVDPAGNDRSTRADRQVARVAWSTVEDAFIQAMRMSGNKGRGLRGGSFTVRSTNAATIITYRKSRFSDDVGVSGTATFNRVTNALDADVRVDVRGSQGGALSFHGILFHPMQPTVQVRGHIGERSIALLTLAN